MYISNVSQNIMNSPESESPAWAAISALQKATTMVEAWLPAFPDCQTSRKMYISDVD